MTWKILEEQQPELAAFGAERLNGKYDFMRGFSTTVCGQTGMIEVLGEGGHNLLWEGQQQHLVLHREGRETVCFRFDEGGDDIWQSDISYYGPGLMGAAAWSPLPKSSTVRSGTEPYGGARDSRTSTTGA